MEIKIILEGLENIDCAEAIEKECQQLEYVSSAEIDFISQRLSVETGGGIKKQDCINDILEIVSLQGSGISAYEEGFQPEHYGQKGYTVDVIRILICVILNAISFFMPDELTKLIFLAMGYFAVSCGIIWKAIKSIIRLKPFSSDVIITIASVGTFVLGNRIEASVVMLFYSLGQLLREMAVEKSRESIINFSELRADKVTVYHEGITEQCSPQYIPQGARMLVKPGEVISFDGTVAKGRTAVDTSIITGNSVPVEVSEGDKVTSGCINLSSSIEIISSCEYKDSTVSKLLRLFEKSHNKKAKIEKTIGSFSNIFTYCVTGIGVLLAAIAILAGGQPTIWLYRGFEFLAVSGLSILAVSVSLGFFAAGGSASASGVIVKGSDIMENLRKCNTAVFDKSVALSDGFFKVSETHPFNDFPEDELIKYGAFAQSVLPDDPFSAPVLEAYGETVNSDLLETEIIEGKGVKCVCNEKDIILCGSYVFLAENEVKMPADSRGIFIHIAFNGKYAGKIEFEHKLLESAPDILKAVKNSGVSKNVIISYDRNEIASRIAEQIGADSAVGEMRPADRSREIEMMMAKGNKVIYIGNGIDDSAALSKSDIGVVLGGVVSEAAISTADVVIMDNDAAKLAEVMKIAHKVCGISYQNIVFSVAAKIAIIVLFAMGITNMSVGVLADTVISALIILNSMRCFK